MLVNGAPHGHCLISLISDALRPEQNGCDFADDNLKFICLNENCYIFDSNLTNRIYRIFAPRGLIVNKSALVLVMPWCRIVRSRDLPNMDRAREILRNTDQNNVQIFSHILKYELTPWNIEFWRPNIWKRVQNRRNIHPYNQQHSRSC